LVRTFLLPLILFKFCIVFKLVAIQIEPFNEHNGLSYLITSINGRRLDKPVKRTRSPVMPMGFDDGVIRRAAKVPDNAKYCCWLNGSDVIEKDAIDAEPNEAIMLLIGGLAFLEKDMRSDNYRAIQINRFQPSESENESEHESGSPRIQITKLSHWLNEYTQTLLDQGRFAVGFN
jgi:hypothetical protein